MLAPFVEVFVFTGSSDFLLTALSVPFAFDWPLDLSSDFESDSASFCHQS